MTPRILIQGRDNTSVLRSGNRLREIDRMPCAQQRAADIRWLKLIAVFASLLAAYWLGTWWPVA